MNDDYDWLWVAASALFCFLWLALGAWSSNDEPKEDGNADCP